MLMHGDDSSHHHAVTDVHVTGERDGIGKNDTVTNFAVVTDVHVDHQQTIAAHHCHASFSGSVNGHVLAQHGSIADLHSSRFALVAKILRFESDTGSGRYAAVVTNCGVTIDNCMSANYGSAAYLDVGTDDCVRTDFHGFVKLGVFMNNRGSVYCGGRHWG